MITLAYCRGAGGPEDHAGVLQGLGEGQYNMGWVANYWHTKYMTNGRARRMLIKKEDEQGSRLLTMMRTT